MLIDDPWRVFFTTDHPNGAPFTTYPEIFALIMSRDVRAEATTRLPQDAVAMTTLPSIAREYTLNEIAIMTRAAPAKLLGLKDRGHLGEGGLADVAVYSPGKDLAKMFRFAHLVFKEGDLVVRDGRVSHYRWGKALKVNPGYDKAIDRRLAGYYDHHFGNSRDLFAVNEHLLPRAGFRGGRMRPMKKNGVRIDNSFAEAFPMRGTAILITAPNRRWARQAAATMTGFATSVIGCGAEAGIDCERPGKSTPDGRPGVRVLVFSMSTDNLQTQLANRVGQCVLTSPGSACFADLDGAERLLVGDSIRYFGDGWQVSKKFGDRHFWRIPVMDGEFLCEATTGLTKKAVGGGNLLIMGATPETTMRAAELAVAAMNGVEGVILPFPGGIVRSGSKVGSKYKAMLASTNDAYCPTLRGAVATSLDEDVGCVLEIVIDGLTEEAVAGAMRAGLAAIVKLGPEHGAVRVGAGNYGGKLGPFHFHLKDLLP